MTKRLEGEGDKEEEKKKKDRKKGTYCLRLFPMLIIVGDEAIVMPMAWPQRGMQSLFNWNYGFGAANVLQPKMGEKEGRAGGDGVSVQYAS